jgi:prevent-host-death family protein
MAAPMYNMHEAKTQLSRLVDKAVEGEEVIVARNGKPVARIVKYEQPKRVLGSLKGKVWIEPGYDIVASDPEIVADFDASADAPL